MFDQALGWVGDLVRWLGSFVPRWELLQVDHGGVKHRPGGKVTALKPGHIYWWWPATTNVETVQTARQTISLPVQHLTTKDGRAVSISWKIVYEIDDPVAALVRTTDFDATIKDVATGAAVKTVLSRTWKELRDEVLDRSALHEVARSARSALREFGVKVITAYVGDLVTPKVHAIITEGSAPILPE